MDLIVGKKKAIVGKDRKIRPGKNADKPVFGISKVPANGKLIATKKRVFIPPPETGIVEVDDVWINSEFQRNLMDNGIDDMIVEYEGLTLAEAAETYRIGCGYTLSAIRTDGRISQIDGQRRLALGKYLKDKYGVNSWEIPSEIVVSKGDEHEAEMFNLRNHKKSLSACEKFKGRLAAGDLVAVGVDKCLDGFGIAIRGVGKSVPTRRVSCVKQIVEAYELDGTGKHLGRVLGVIGSAWGDSKNKKTVKDAYSSQVLGAVCIFIGKNPKADLDKIASKLGRWRPQQIVDMAPPSKIASGHTRPFAVADEIAAIYKARHRR